MRCQNVVEPKRTRSFPRYWGLQPAQDRILARLTENGAASKGVIAHVASPDGMGSVDAVKTQISLLRTALKDRSVTIRNIRGWGYEVDPLCRRRLKQFMEVQAEEMVVS